VVAVLPLSVLEDRGKEGPVERPKLRGPKAGRCIVKRRPLSDEGSAVRAYRVEGPKGERRRPHSHASGAGHQDGGVGLMGGGEP
jgi:quercetin dioxygenase-like cupin family protein